MNHERRFKKSRLSQLIAAGVVTGLASSAYAGDYTFNQNELSWLSEPTSTVAVQSNGVANPATITVDGQASTLPNVRFALQDLAGTAGSTFLRVFIEVKDPNGADEIEMRMGVVEVTSTASGVSNVEMVTSGPNYETVQVYALREGVGSNLEISAEFGANSDVITGTGNLVTLSVENIVGLLSDNATFNEIINVFAGSGTLEYSIGIQELGGTSRLGTSSAGSFTVSPVQPTFDLADGALASQFSNGSFISGSLLLQDEQPPVDVVDPDVVEGQDNDADGLANTVEDELAQNGTISSGTVSQTESITSNSNTQLNAALQAKADGKTVTKTNFLNIISTASKAGKTASLVASSDAQSSTNGVASEAVKVLNGGAAALSELARQETAGSDDPLTEDEKGQVSQALSNMSTTAANLSKRGGTVQDMVSLADAMFTTVAAAKALKVPVSDEIMTQLVDNSKQLIRALIAASTGQDVISDEVAAQRMNDNPALLASVLNNAFPLPASSHKSSAELESDVSEGTGSRGVALSTTARNALKNGLGSGSSTSSTRIGGQALPAAADDLLNQIISRILGGGALQVPVLNAERDGGVSQLEDGDTAEISYDEETQLYTVSIGSEVYLAQAVGAKAVPAGLDANLSMRADGRVVLVGNNGFAVELAPAPVDIFYFTAAVDGANFTPTFRDNGSFSLQLSETSSLSGTFTYDNMAGSNLAESCGSVSFAGPTTAPNSPSHAYIMNCSDSDVSQRIVPFVAQSNFYKTLNALDIDVTTDRNTGIVTASGVGRFKPSFFVATTRTQAEANYYNTNEGGYAIAFQGLDINNDGVLDVKVITRNSVQVLYGVQ